MKCLAPTMYRFVTCQANNSKTIDHCVLPSLPYYTTLPNSKIQINRQTFTSIVYTTQPAVQPVVSCKRSLRCNTTVELKLKSVSQTRRKFPGESHVKEFRKSVQAYMCRSCEQKLCLIMAALCNRKAIIVLPCSFFLLSFFFYLFFPRLISAAVDWMSAILLHMAWPQCEFRMQV